MTESAPLRIAESPAQDRPRERLLAQGAEPLRLAELFAILIRAGRRGESAVQAGEKLAARFADALDQLPDATWEELREVSTVVGKSAFCQIMAGTELGRRVGTAQQSRPLVHRISSSQAAKAFCQHRFARLVADGHREEFHVVCLDTKNQVIDVHQISVGTLDASLVHPREVFRPAVKSAASSVLLVHNHPSGDPTPSPQDLTVTARLESAGEVMGIDVLDHLIVTAHETLSIREYR